MKLNRTYRKLCKIYLQNKRIEEQQKAIGLSLIEVNKHQLELGKVIIHLKNTKRL
jgi:hypothetical protein